MKQKLNQLLVLQFWIKLLLYGLLFSLWFPLKRVFLTNLSFVTGQYSDFLSFSLYLSDFIILTLVILLSVRKKSLRWVIPERGVVALFVFWLILTQILNVHYHSSINWWTFGKFVELVVSYETVKTLAKEGWLTWVFWKVFTGIGLAVGGIAIIQFYLQHSIGLSLVGESSINGAMFDVAKIAATGGVFVRAYGTFPHPNVLSAYIFVALMLFPAFYIHAHNAKSRILALTGLAVSTISLLLTFSRAAFLATVVGWATFYFIMLIRRISPKRALSIAGFFLIVCFGVNSLILYPLLANRSKVGDSAIQERVIYNQIAINMLKSQPLHGFGLGNTLLHMKQFSPTTLAPWQTQPIHNYFLLAAVEMGIIGSILLFTLFTSHIFRLFAAIKQNALEHTIFYTAFVSVLFGFLILMQFDHYFYTLHQTQLLLWIILGFIAGITKAPTRTEASAF